MPGYARARRGRYDPTRTLGKEEITGNGGSNGHAGRLPATNGEWAVTGSASLQLRGFECEARDIDILAATEVSNYAATALSEWTVRPLAIVQTNEICSLFAQYNVNGVIAEIMADVRNRLANGSWYPHRE